MMNFTLDMVEARVLGALVEKEITTPEYYPLSLNALVNACNQKSNRDPAMELDESAVRAALRTLDEKDLARSAAVNDRVAKYEHQLREAFNFTRQEIAILCELLLRGPQTPGELRSRASRMQAFEDLGQVQSTLQKLMSREPALVAVMARQPGTKEVRYAQLFSGGLLQADAEAYTGTKAEPSAPTGDRVASLEAEIAELRREVTELRSQVAEFRKLLE